MMLFLTMPSSLLVMLLFIQTVSLQRDFPFYIPQGEVRVMEWLTSQTNPENDLVLTYYPTGYYFPIFSDTDVFSGPFFLTVDFDIKENLVEKFRQTETTNDWGITHIYQGKYENTLSGRSITPSGTLVYDQSGVKIYRVSDQLP